MSNETVLKWEPASKTPEKEGEYLVRYGEDMNFYVVLKYIINPVEGLNWKKGWHQLDNFLDPYTDYLDGMMEWAELPNRRRR